MSERQTKYVRMPNGVLHEITGEKQRLWGEWADRVLRRGYLVGPEGPRLQDTGDPPQGDV